MNILTDLLPTTIEVQGVRYPINWDFRTSILFELLMFDEEINEKEKGMNVLELYFDYETILNFDENNLNEVFDQIFWFYSCGKRDIYTSNSENDTDEMEFKKIYYYNYDDSYIYSAFLQQYNIDLNDIQNLHWWKFKAMFNSLTEDCKFVQILSYRSVDIDKIKDIEQKNFYKKMKNHYALPLSKKEREEKEKIDLINQMLLRGEDPRDLLHN